jgi:hypothetical protein
MPRGVILRLRIPPRKFKVISRFGKALKSNHNRRKEEGRRKKEEGRRKKEEGRRKKEEGRRKKEEGRRKKEEGRRSKLFYSWSDSWPKQFGMV